MKCLNNYFANDNNPPLRIRTPLRSLAHPRLNPKHAPPRHLQDSIGTNGVLPRGVRRSLRRAGRLGHEGAHRRRVLGPALHAPTLSAGELYRSLPTEGRTGGGGGDSVEGSGYDARPRRLRRRYLAAESSRRAGYHRTYNGYGGDGVR